MEENCSITDQSDLKRGLDLACHSIWTWKEYSTLFNISIYLIPKRLFKKGNFIWRDIWAEGII
jgi:hypothetical protein